MEQTCLTFLAAGAFVEGADLVLTSFCFFGLGSPSSSSLSDELAEESNLNKIKSYRVHQWLKTTLVGLF